MRRGARQQPAPVGNPAARQWLPDSAPGCCGQLISNSLPSGSFIPTA
jgi:hypothetical protein